MHEIAEITVNSAFNLRKCLYVGSSVTFKSSKAEVTVPRSRRILVTTIDKSIDDELDDLNQCFLGRDKEVIKKIIHAYTRPIKRVLIKYGIKKPFGVVVGDTVNPFLVPVLCKTRPTDVGGFAVICKLEQHRHWSLPEIVDSIDVPWQEKIDHEIIWRGAMTGLALRDAPHFGSRLHLARKSEALARHGISVGFTEVGQARLFGNDVFEMCKKLLVEGVPVGELMQYKYQLCLEGNDVSTALKWALRSNSVVLMPQPTFESWACESQLVPWFHYVPVNYDLSNLVEIFEWCRENDDRCYNISQNGREFIDRIMKKPDDDHLMEEIVLEFVDRYSFRYAN